MTRALSVVCVAFLMLGSTATAFARPAIAVLGLEVVDPSGTPTAADAQVAKELTDGLRSRAKAGTGQYQLAPGSDKELVDQKLLNNCEDEKPGCMAAIGNQLGAEVLMYGKIQKDGKSYQVTMKVLDVGRKSILKSSSDLVPLAESQGAAAQGWAKKIYAKLTGEQSSGTLIVRLANAERGTILIDGQEKGNINNGSGQVGGLSEGKYRLTVESEGFRRWEKDVTITGGKTESVSAELENGSIEGGIGGGGEGGSGGGGGGGGPVDGVTRGNGMWKGISIGAVAVTAGGIGLALYGNSLRSDARNKLCDGGAYHAVDPSCPEMGAMPLDEAAVNDLNDRGDRGKLLGRVGAGIAVVSGGFAVFAIYKGFIAKSSPSSKEHASRGQRVRRERFVLTPIVSPQGGGATLRIDW